MRHEDSSAPGHQRTITTPKAKVHMYNSITINQKVNEIYLTQITCLECAKDGTYQICIDNPVHVRKNDGDISKKGFLDGYLRT